MMDIERGERARALLEDKTLIGVLDKLAQQAIDRWRTSDWTDSETREEAYHMVRAADGVRAELTRLVADGDLARNLQTRE